MEEIPEELYTPLGAEPQAEPDAQVQRVTGIAQFIWEGGLQNSCNNSCASVSPYALHRSLQSKLDIEFTISEVWRVDSR